MFREELQQLNRPWGCSFTTRQHAEKVRSLLQLVLPHLLMWDFGCSCASWTTWMSVWLLTVRFVRWSISPQTAGCNNDQISCLSQEKSRNCPTILNFIFHIYFIVCQFHILNTDSLEIFISNTWHLESTVILFSSRLAKNSVLDVFIWAGRIHLCIQTSLKLSASKAEQSLTAPRVI